MSHQCCNWLKVQHIWALLTHRKHSLILLQSPEVLTTGAGCPVDNHNATMTIGPNGPVLLQDTQFLDVMTHFDRERIPERVVHAKGGGAFGYFEVTHDITKYCKARIFEKVGKRTPCAVRFSTVGGLSLLDLLFRVKAKIQHSLSYSSTEVQSWMTPDSLPSVA